MSVLMTPIIQTIETFDPSYEHYIYFTYNDNQAVKNRCVIKNNTTGEIAYDKTINTLSTYHLLEANSLTPGIAYTAQIQVFDQENNQSNLSDPVLFYCCTTPIFKLLDEYNQDLNLINSSNGSSFRTSLLYDQHEGELLRSYQFILYDVNRHPLKYSDILFTNGNKNYIFTDLVDGNTYYIKAIGETMHGIILETNMYQINIKYSSILMPANVNFLVSNHEKDGYISIHTNIINIPYELKDENNYEFTSDGSVRIWSNELNYNQCFKLSGDFILQIEAKNIPINEDFLQLDNLFLRIINVCGKYYVKLYGVESVQQIIPFPSFIISKKLLTSSDKFLLTQNGKILSFASLDYNDDVFLVFEIKRVNNVYGVKVYVKEV